jgi:hypothetical protein
LGTVSVDLEDGRRFLMNIWESAEHARRALPVLAPALDRLVNPLLSSPSVLVGTGPVVSWPFEEATPTPAGGNENRR